MEKSREAFRTISEVAEWLDVPTHVLRFWESRFSQIKPVKRAGGRRYYRPSDMRVIGGVKTLLHDQGMTIRGVQKLFREQGIKHVSSFSPKLFARDGSREEPGAEGEIIEATALPATEESVAPAPAARSTYDATPDPVVDPVEDAQVEDMPSEAPVFRPSRRPAVVEEDVAPGAAAALAANDAATGEGPEEIDAAAEPVLEAEVIPAPSIPPTPNVPQTDPADDDPAYAAEPGNLVRLLVTKRSTLRRDREALGLAADRLKELRERLG